MLYYLTGFLLLIGIFFWGIGLALLLTPGRHKKFAPIFAFPSGIALQSIVVWLGAHSGLSGTDAYGRIAVAIPLSLLICAIRQQKHSKRRMRITSFTPLAGLMVVQLSVLLFPFLLRGGPLTTVSIGSLDAADYAAGARTFQEFAWKDRSGFLGQAEVVSVGSVHNFFDFWLQTNHFTPSALVALNGSILGLKPYQLTGILTLVLLTTSLPMVFWLARAGFRLRPGSALWVTALYAFSPINWYAAFHVSPAQIIAANALTLLTYCGFAAWRAGITWPRLLSWSGLLFVAYGLVFGAYNFMIVVSLVPVVAYAGALTLKNGSYARFFRWVAFMLALLGISGFVYFERATGVMERLILFKAGFGWPIPMLTPEGWLGLLDGPWLTSLGFTARIPLALGSIALILTGLFFASKRRTRVAWSAVAASVPILAGYYYLQWKEQHTGQGSSYEAYKLFSVFYPGILVACCLWIDEAHKRRGRLLVTMIAGSLLLVTIAGDWRFFYRLRAPILSVDAATIALSELEKDPKIASLNMRLDNGWAILWANAFLLKKLQYFENVCYEGRSATALNGDWDLVGEFLEIKLPEGGSRRLAPGFSLVRRQSPLYVEALAEYGWAERLRDDPYRTPRTRWVTADAGIVRINNPHSTALEAKIEATLRSINTRDCIISVENSGSSSIIRLNDKPQAWTMAVTLPPGNTLIRFSSPQEPDQIGGRIKSSVTVGVDGINIEIRHR